MILPTHMCRRNGSSCCGNWFQVVMLWWWSCITKQGDKPLTKDLGLCSTERGRKGHKSQLLSPKSAATACTVRKRQLQIAGHLGISAHQRVIHCLARMKMGHESASGENVNVFHVHPSSEYCVMASWNNTLCNQLNKEDTPSTTYSWRARLCSFWYVVCLTSW